MQNIFLKCHYRKKITKGKSKSLKEFWHFRKTNIFKKIIFFQNVKIIFFHRKKKLSIFFGSLDRCKIFWRIHFSHPRSDLTSISGQNRLSKKKSWFWARFSKVAVCFFTDGRKSAPIFFRKNIFPWNKKKYRAMPLSFPKHQKTGPNSKNSRS